MWQPSWQQTNRNNNSGFAEYSELTPPEIWRCHRIQLWQQRGVGVTLWCDSKTKTYLYLTAGVMRLPQSDNCVIILLLTQSRCLAQRQGGSAHSHSASSSVQWASNNFATQTLLELESQRRPQSNTNCFIGERGQRSGLFAILSFSTSPLHRRTST